MGRLFKDDPMMEGLHRIRRKKAKEWQELLEKYPVEEALQIQRERLKTKLARDGYELVERGDGTAFLRRLPRKAKIGSVRAQKA